jgi:hypothetical protein
MASTNQRNLDSNQPPFGRNQYLKDYSYAIRHLKMGESEEDVARAMANYRKDMKATDAVQYGERTVEKAATAIAHENAMAESLSQQQVAPLGDGLQKVLDNHVEEVTSEEYARRLYSSGLDTQTIDLLEQHRGLSTEEAIEVANKAAATFHAERDTEYAVTQLRREKAPSEIAAAITKYRGPAVTDPEQYGKDVVAIAQQVMDVEKDIPTKTLVDARIDAAALKFKRDAAFAYRRLNQGADDNQVLLDIQQRNPNQALNTFNYQILGKTDHSYTLAVLTQGQALQNVMQQGGYKLESALDVIQRDFTKDLAGAVQDRRLGRSHADTLEHITESDTVKQRYGQALVNNADHILNEERSISVRPELTRELTNSYRRQEKLERDNFHTPKAQLESDAAKNDPAQKLANQSKALNIPDGSKIISANTHDGAYYGKVISETEDKFIQQIGGKAVVVHSKLDTGSDGMKVGHTYNVRYNEGKAALKQYGGQNRTQEKGPDQGR